MEQQFVDLAIDGNWVLLAAIVIGVVVRLLKADSKLIPAVVPAKWRPWLAIGLGLVSGVLEAVATGKPWKSALVGGLVSGVLPILGHELVVESLRSGKEIGGDKPTEPPAPQPPSITGGGILLALCFALALTGCPRDPLSPRHVARGAVLAVSHAVKVADHVCADEAKSRAAAGKVNDAIALAKKCAQGYDVARKALESAAYAVDAWGTGEQTGKAVCAASEGAMGLRIMVDAMETAGVVELPAEVYDGLAAAKWMAAQATGGKCEVRQ